MHVSCELKAASDILVGDENVMKCTIIPSGVARHQAATLPTLHTMCESKLYILISGRFDPIIHSTDET